METNYWGLLPIDMLSQITLTVSDADNEDSMVLNNVDSTEDSTQINDTQTDDTQMNDAQTDDTQSTDKSISDSDIFESVEVPVTATPVGSEIKVLVGNTTGKELDID